MFSLFPCLAHYAYNAGSRVYVGGLFSRRFWVAEKFATANMLQSSRALCCPMLIALDGNVAIPATQCTDSVLWYFSFEHG